MRGPPPRSGGRSAPGTFVTSEACVVVLPLAPTQWRLGTWSHTSGTLVGTGTFRCAACDYVVSLAAADMLPPCPSCGGEEFVRASLFTTANVPAPSLPDASATEELRLADARGEMEEPG